MTATVYGLKNCDTCKKATKWLDRFGVAHTFVDYRDAKPTPETLVDWAGTLGGFEAMVNRSSTTWLTTPRSTLDCALRAPTPSRSRPTTMTMTATAIRASARSRASCRSSRRRC